MPIYKYEILTANGSKKEGSILADDYKCAYEILSAKHYHPIEIKRAYFVSRKVSLDDVSTFFMHINFQLKCGVGINDAIESFAGFHDNQILNATLWDISNSLKKGEGIGEAFERGNFDSVIVGLLKSAENTGNIIAVVSNILDFLKLQINWKDNVKRAIAYPIFIAMVAVIVLILSIGILGPQVMSLIKSFDEKGIPPLTQFAINILPQAGEILIILMSISFLFMLTSRGRILLSKLILKIPKIGELIIKIFMWQFCKIMHIALDAKLNFVQSLNLAIETIKFSYLKIELESIRNNILEGYKVAESFFNSTVIPKEIITSICVGEEGNDLSSSFGHVSEDLYKEILFGIKSFGQIMSIGLTVFTGLIFIFILCSLFYPIYNYVEIAGA